MSPRTWDPHPLSTTILEVLKRKGPLTDVELYDTVRTIHEAIGFRDLNKTLMRMEIEGRIYVSPLTKGKRRVELVSHERS